MAHHVPSDPLLAADENSPALERYREERAQLARLDRLERERLLVPRDEVREGLGQIAQLIRMVGEALQRQYGQAAVELLYEALDEAEQVIEERFGDVPIKELLVEDDRGTDVTGDEDHDDDVVPNVPGDEDDDVVTSVPGEHEAADDDE